MRDLPLDPPDRGLTEREQMAQDEVIYRETARIGEVDVQIGAERFVFWIGDYHDAIAFVPLISAIARGDTYSAIQFVERLRGEYTAYLRTDETLCAEILAEHGEEHGHA